MIHPTAIIHPKARVDSSVTVGPYAVVDEGVEIGPDCWLGPHVHLTGVTTIGARNRFHAGCVIGDAPQDLKYSGAPTKLVMGEGNVFREHVTVHRSTTPDEATTIGSNNYFMAASHIGHNCHIGNSVIIANAAMLGGHVHVDDRVFISATCMLHQFVRVGTLALMQGGSGTSKDLPPYTIAMGNNGICGLNTIGLRRAGFTSEQRLELRALYQALFRSPGLWRERVAEAQGRFTSPTARVMLDFILASKRGVACDVSAKAAPEEEPI